MATAAAGGDRLGEILLREGLVTREQLAQALTEQKNSKHRLGYVLVKLGLVQELEITKVLARQYRMPAVDLTRFEVDPKIIKLVPAEMAIKSVVLPLKREGRTLTVAMADPTDLGLLEDLKFITRFDLFPVIAGEYTLRNLIEKHYESSDQQLQSILKDMEDTGEDVEVVETEEDETVTQAQIDDAPVVKLINGLLTDAVRRGASDIHIEPFEHEIRVRYRIDGSLLEFMRQPLKMKAALTSRV
jgi:type IV pilus assembly protein PilB